MLKIARSFNCGCDRLNIISPGGTTEFSTARATPWESENIILRGLKGRHKMGHELTRFGAHTESRLTRRRLPAHTPHVSNQRFFTLSCLEHAIADGHAILTGEGKQQNLLCVAGMTRCFFDFSEEYGVLECGRISGPFVESVKAEVPPTPGSTQSLENIKYH